MRIQTFNVGNLLTNCYIVSCPETTEAIVIDPGFWATYEAEQVIRYVDENSLKVQFIINTHGHADHISGDDILKRKFGVPVCIHQYDAGFLVGLSDNLSPANVLFEDGRLITFGRVKLKVMHTPGHTMGSISILGKNVVFTGDTLFAGGIGRTDFPGGSNRDMKASLQKLVSLPNDFIVYPGHGCVSTIGEEKRVNPFLMQIGT